MTVPAQPPAPSTQLTEEQRIERYLAREAGAPPSATPPPAGPARQTAPPTPDELPETPEDRQIRELEEAARIGTDLGPKPDQQTPGEPQPPEGNDQQQAQHDLDALTPVTTVADFARHLEMEPDEFMGLVHLQGREGRPVTLAEVHQGYLSGDGQTVVMPPAEVQQKMADLETARSRMQTEHEQEMGRLKVTLNQLITHMEQGPQLSAQDLEALKRDDPAAYFDYTVKRLERERAAEAAFVKLRAHEELQARHQNEARDEFRRAEALKVPSRIPEWNDPQIRHREAVALDGWLQGDRFGFTPQELLLLDDSRMLEIAVKAMRYDNLIRAQRLSRARVKGLPKPMAPAARVEPPAPRVAEEGEYQEARTRLRSSGSVEDAAAAIRARLGQSATGGSQR